MSAREAQRLETRARLFDAAVAAIGRSGLAGADVSTIAATVGVSRGTFYFHFPTKEHVVVEMERTEEVKIVSRLGTRRQELTDLSSVLSLLVREVLAAERRLGPVFFRDMLGLHFSSTRPVEEELSAHPLAEFVIAAIAEAQGAGRVARDKDPGELGVFFLTGLFALLVIDKSSSKARAALMDR
jgi:AcrR family transcriptional regulator